MPLQTSHVQGGRAVKEHQAATRRGEVDKSVVAEHAWAEQHHPVWDEVSILQQAESRDDIVRIKEAFCITTADHRKSLNRDQGTAINDCWKSLLQCWH